MTKYFGKYRGVVRNNVDADRRGRILVSVPAVHGTMGDDWAMPCVPFAGISAGFYAVPPIGAGVWVEFEEGDADKPVWTGGWWGSSSEIPSLALGGVPATPNVCIQTTGMNTILLSDSPGAAGITLQTATGAKITLDATGITLDNGQGATISLRGNAVSVNGGALEVM